MTSPSRPKRKAPVYSRAVQFDVARALASCRAHCWCDAQLSILDQLIATLCDDFHEHDPTFDANAFASIARHRQGRFVPDEVARPTPTQDI